MTKPVASRVWIRSNALPCQKRQSRCADEARVLVQRRQHYPDILECRHCPLRDVALNAGLEPVELVGKPASHYDDIGTEDMDQAGEAAAENFRFLVNQLICQTIAVSGGGKTLRLSMVPPSLPIVVPLDSIALIWARCAKAVRIRRPRNSPCCRRDKVLRSARPTCARHGLPCPCGRARRDHPTQRHRQCRCSP